MRKLTRGCTGSLANTSSEGGRASARPPDPNRKADQLALYVSDSSNFRINIRKEETIFTPKGDVMGKRPRLFAQFQRGGMPDWAYDFVTRKLEFAGQSEGMPLSYRTGVFDSHQAQKDYGWSDEDRRLVEEFLDANQGSNFVRAEPPRLAAPWPAIEKVTVQGRRTLEVVADQLVKTASEIGVPVEDVAAYVRQEQGRVNGWDDRLVALLVEKAARAAAVEEPSEDLVEA